jgi:hypothetical protein
MMDGSFMKIGDLGHLIKKGQYKWSCECSKLFLNGVFESKKVFAG